MHVDEPMSDLLCYMRRHGLRGAWRAMTFRHIFITRFHGRPWVKRLVGMNIVGLKWRMLCYMIRHGLRGAWRAMTF